MVPQLPCPSPHRPAACWSLKSLYWDLPLGFWLGTEKGLISRDGQQLQRSVLIILRLVCFLADWPALLLVLRVRKCGWVPCGPPCLGMITVRTDKFFALDLLNRCVQYYKQFENVRSTKSSQVCTVYQGMLDSPLNATLKTHGSDPQGGGSLEGRQTREVPTRIPCSCRVMQVCRRRVHSGRSS